LVLRVPAHSVVSSERFPEILMYLTNIKPEPIRWACQRSGVEEAKLEERFPKLLKWISGEAHPTMKQLEDLAKATLTPLGHLFLSAPPKENDRFLTFGRSRTASLSSPVQLYWKRSTRCSGGKIG